MLPALQLLRKDEESSGTDVGTLICERAWLRLEEAVCSRRRSGVKEEGGGR